MGRGLVPHHHLTGGKQRRTALCRVLRLVSKGLEILAEVLRLVRIAEVEVHVSLPDAGEISAELLVIVRR